jgi:putative redox protein
MIRPAGIVSGMTTRTASLALDGPALRFTATTGSGHTLVLDSTDGDAGPRPAELVAVAAAACAAMDVISILRKKRQQVSRYEIKATAEQREDAHPAVFVRIDVIHVVEGEAVEVEAVRRAIELSATRYCAVGGTLSTGVTEIHHRYIVRSGGDEVMGEALVTGPFERHGDGAVIVDHEPIGR